MYTEMQKKADSKSQKIRINVCLSIMIIIFSIFAIRLVDWQLVHGEEYRQLAERSTGYTEKTDATRGEILDCNGEGLVVNSTHYKVVFDKLYMDEDKLDSTILKLIDILYRAREKWDDTLPILLSSNGAYNYKSDCKDEINYLLSSDFLDMSPNTSAERCFYELVKRYELNKEYSPTQLRNLVSVHYNMELKGYANSKTYVFASDIQQSTVSAVSENMQGVSGVDVQTYLKRGAADPDIAPHILGALGSVTEDEYKKLSDKGYSLDDSIGKFGIELAFENELKGKGGTKIVQRNTDGTIINSVETETAKPGNTVFLTIDSKLQKTAVRSLAENVKAAKANGKAESEYKGEKGYGEDCEAGAVVMLSVKDFSVLAAASYPTYDLNKYSNYGSYYLKLSQNKFSPLYNRAFAGNFACGSVYKPCVACAALEEKTIKKDELIYCNEEYDYYPSNVVKCMHFHKDMNVTDAIVQSCNCFFAETGRRMGIETMYLYAQKFGLGEYTGVEIEESEGVLAGRDSKSWMPGNTVQAAIGQSDNAFTPLQLATYTATIANNGVRLKTHMLDKITNYEQTKIIKKYTAQKVEDCSVSKKNLDIVKKAMLKVSTSENGTANSIFGNYKIKVASKTGTAENSGSDHATFICFAPYDNPQVAIAVVIENGARSRFAMQVAKDLLDSYFD